MTGRLLAWDTGGYWSTVRALELFYSLPILGPLFAFLVGGTELDGMVLIRFYFLHVFVLPTLILILLFLNFSGVRRVGLSPLPGESRGGLAVYRVYLHNLLILIILIFGGLITLATLVPAPFQAIADPFHTPSGVRPPWYLLASHGFMEAFPSIVPRWLRALVLEGALALTILLPFIDRGRTGVSGGRRWAIAIGLAVLICWLGFTWYGYSLEATR
jgi:quinol-cytochrome oxidoreductase complex cytochrome b subunit